MQNSALTLQHKLAQGTAAHRFIVACLNSFKICRILCAFKKLQLVEAIMMHCSWISFTRRYRRFEKRIVWSFNMTQKLLINAILKYAGSRCHWVPGYKTRSFNFLCISLLVRACSFHSWNGLGPALYVCWLFWDKPGVILGFIFRFTVSINYFGSFTVFNDIKMKQLEESVFFFNWFLFTVLSNL